MPRVWAIYSGEKETQDLVDQLRADLDGSNIAELKSFVAVTHEGDEKVLQDRQRGKVESYLSNGEKIHELTNEIVSTKFVCALVTPEFLKKRFCCIELACLLLRSESEYPTFFLNFSEKELMDVIRSDDFITRMAGYYLNDRADIDQSLIQISDKATEKELCVHFVDLINKRLDCHVNVSSSATGAVKAVNEYLKTNNNWLEYPKVTDAYLSWIEAVENAQLRNFLDQEFGQSSDSCEGSHQVLSVELFGFDRFNENTAEDFIEALESYAEVQSSGREKRLFKRQLEILTGLIAIPFVDPKWVASMTRMLDVYTLVRMPMPPGAKEPGSYDPLYTALAVSFVSGKIPVLRLEKLVGIATESPVAKGAIKLSQMPTIPDTNEEKSLEDGVNSLLKLVYKGVSHKPPEELLDSQAKLTSIEILDLHGTLVSEVSKSRFTYFIEFDEGTYRRFESWHRVIEGMHRQLNTGQNRQVNLPMVITNTDKTITQLPPGTDATVRFRALRRILDLFDKPAESSI